MPSKQCAMGGCAFQEAIAVLFSEKINIILGKVPKHPPFGLVVLFNVFIQGIVTSKTN